MDLQKIREVHETTSEEEANRYLHAGWVLLTSAPGTSSAGDGERPYVLYSLGHPDDE